MPDTTITLLSGKKLIVRDTEEEVTQKTVAFLKSIGLYATMNDREGNASV
ncbi:hypothetical protein GCM10007096_21270 [Pullulanibacillus pueri]|uniref:Uncharacterized protein n=1 Tax=Pullulanibacillus pueri TaxID=1437324 RepID=A0A8J2ZVS6_9BACL|nr:hypothetical protein GCM10007096_21270 [Pullulanibacillus pueri]